MFKIIIYFSGFKPGVFKPALVQSEINSFWLQLHSALTFLQVRLRFQLFAKFGINRKGWSQIPPALKNWYVPTSVPIWHLINSVSLLELEVSSSYFSSSCFFLAHCPIDMTAFFLSFHVISSFQGREGVGRVGQCQGRAGRSVS